MAEKRDSKPGPAEIAEFRLLKRGEELHRQFKEQADLFTHMMGPNGGGIRTLAMLDTLRALLTLYQDIAVHEDALLTLKGRV